ncbi:MAG: hypothetical protein WHX52_01725 [Anaerolineae bacterium]
MRKIQVFGILLMLLVLLACNLPRPTPRASTAPTTTPYVMCTPPACTGDEVYYCPGECLGGCGTTCVTPTAELPTPTFTPEPTSTPEPISSPTNTPFVMCTPPACAANEVYYCPDACPGGCGTTCVTPTPKPAAGAPVIQSFTADRASIVEGETVNVTWKATGGSEAYLMWMGGAGLTEGIGNLDPDGGTAAIAPRSGGPVVLQVRNSAGTTEATLALTIACANVWVPELAVAMAGKCPNPAEIGWAAQQPFEHGFMLWLQPSNTIYVFFNNYGGQSYRAYTDNFKEGDPERDPSLTPPAGLLQPIRGFGLVWRTYPEVRDHLGWATAPESGFNTWRQSYQGYGMHNLTIWVKDINQKIYKLNSMGSVWEIYTP